MSRPESYREQKACATCTYRKRRPSTLSDWYCTVTRPTIGDVQRGEVTVHLNGICDEWKAEEGGGDE